MNLTAILASDWNWDLLLKAAGAVVGVAVASIQVRSFFLASRASIKTDLEILKLLDSSHPHFDTIRAEVDSRIAQHYRAADQKSLWTDSDRLTQLFVAGIMGIGFSYWTIRLVEPGWTWWALPTGYFGLAGIGGMVAALVGPVRRPQSRTRQPRGSGRSKR